MNLFGILKATAELPRFARVTFFVAKKVTKENSQCRGKSAICNAAGIFRCGILPRRKTVRILRTALRVFRLGQVRVHGLVVGTIAIVEKRVGRGPAAESSVQWLEKTAELSRFAQVTFFVAKKVTKENSQYLGKSAVGDMAGIFRCGILPRRKTVRILRTALRVYYLE